MAARTAVVLDSSDVGMGYRGGLEAISVGAIVSTRFLSLMLKHSLFASFVFEPIHASQIRFEHANGDGHHARLDHPSTDAFAATHTNVDDALKSETPLPDGLHLLDGKSANLWRRRLGYGSKNADQTFETSI